MMSVECTYVTSQFSHFQYPLGLVHKLRKETECIWGKSVYKVKEEKDNLVVPYSKSAEPVPGYSLRMVSVYCTPQN